MTHARLYLTDSDVLRGLMTWAPGGKSYDIRGLAKAVDVSKSKIGALLSGERPSVTTEVAERICEVLEVRRDALFYEKLPTPMGVGSLDQEGESRGHGHHRADDAAPTRRLHQLGEDDGQVEPYRRRPPR